MNKRNLILSSLILATSTFGSLPAAEPALIKIDLDRTIGAIDPNIYSSFLEPLSRGPGATPGPGFGRGVVYGPLYDPESPHSDENGFRKEYVQQIKDLKVSSVRWPGGNFVSGHHWEDAIGPTPARSRTRPTGWNTATHPPARATPTFA
jgi:alpha-N-arabinofuranosidase